jgi:penicillin-binding protein 1B
MVIAADALAHSLNVATIALAQKVGYENVAALGRAVGVTSARGTPSVAIGTYSATPIDMAGAYTVFANYGVHLNPWLLASVRNTNGDIVADFAPTAKQVLDPRVSYLTQTLLQGVIERGTAIGVRTHGFKAPAAGKTGTSHDAWFAGYTSNLICVIWVGNDDYTDVKLQGALAAAPIWAEFMNRAALLPQYSDMHGFTKADGVTDVRIDRVTDRPADSSCTNDFTAAFLDGTIPPGTCSNMSEPTQSIVNRVLETTKPATQPPQ